MSGSKRTRINRPPLPVLDAEAVRMFKRGLALIDEGRDETTEFAKLSTLLHRKLGLKPWMPTVFDAAADPPTEPHFFCDWKYVVSLHEQLSELARPQLVSVREAEADDDAEQAELPR